MPRNKSALTSGGLGNHSEKSLALGRLPCKAGMDVLAQAAVVDADCDEMTDSGNRQTFQMSEECGLVLNLYLYSCCCFIVAALRNGMRACFLDWEIKWMLKFFGSLLVGIGFSVRERRRRSRLGPLGRLWVGVVLRMWLEVTRSRFIHGCSDLPL